jgi:NADH-quinone oxidoreductase subunit N
MINIWSDILALGPILVVACVSLLVLLIEAFYKKTETLNCWISILGLLLGAIVAAGGLGASRLVFGGMLTTGGYASFFAIISCIAGILSVMLSKAYVRKQAIEHGEFYALLLLAVVGMMIMAAAADLILLFIGLELMSIAFYVMAGFARERLTSNEAALKYFLLGAFATGFLLYGIALLYGTTGSTKIALIIAAGGAHATDTVFLIGVAFLIIGLAFKIAAVPFHMWVPDVYEGAPTTVTGFMSTGGKAAAFSVVLLVFTPQLLAHLGALREVLAALAALSMVVGNIIALSQYSIKRMLAYSSIAHAGYILTGVVAANEYGQNGVLFYLLAYTLMNVGAFGVLAVLESEEGKNLTFDGYAGLSSSRPLVAAMMALFMFSLTGIPPFAGFVGKYYVFVGAVEGGYTWLAILGVLMSVVSAYYYLRVVVVMYFKEKTDEIRLSAEPLDYTALLVSAAAIVIIGLFPSLVLQFTSRFF